MNFFFFVFLFFLLPFFQMCGGRYTAIYLFSGVVDDWRMVGLRMYESGMTSKRFHFQFRIGRSRVVNT